MDEKELKSERLDVYLFQQGLCSSRALAKRLILDSSILVNGIVENKPSTMVSLHDEIKILENKLTTYVSRGALKLESALDSFNIAVKGLVCLDIGASTGGFTDVLIQRGASRVYAVENGTDQLHEKLRNDSRVISLENTNARNLPPNLVPVCDLVVMDVSFVSQTLFYKTITEHLKRDGILVSLIKPQFEAGRQFLNKKGVVRDKKVHSRIIDEIISTAALHGLKSVGTCVSPIQGGDGNVEYLAVFIHRGGES